MEINVNNTRFNITVEDLESADVAFSFWKGRRFKLCGNDVKEHFLRYNDLVEGVLAEDATFIEGEDKQKIYATLYILKDKGYPYSGSCWTKVMLSIKQLFGNIFRQQLLDQLEAKLNAESEELSISKESNFDTFVSPICNDYFIDVRPLFFKYAGRTACFPLMLTCKLFHEIITADKHRNYHLRDLDLLKQIFRDCQHTKFDPLHRPTIELANIISIESKCLLLLAEFFPKEVNIIAPPNKVYEKSSVYIKHQKRLATLLAKIDPKSALKVVASMDPEGYPVQRFCAVAAIHKNSKLCDEKQVLAMGNIAYADLLYLELEEPEGVFLNLMPEKRGFLNHKNLIELFEASIGIHSPLARHSLKLLGTYSSFIDNPYVTAGHYFQDLAKNVKSIEIGLLIKSKFLETIVGLLSKPLESDLDLDFDQDSKYNMPRSLAVIAKTLVIFDQKKAILALKLAMNSIAELQKYVKFEALIEIAEAFAYFDQNQAFEVSKLALKTVETEGLYAYSQNRKYLWNYRLRLFDSLGRIIKIFAASNREYAIQVLREIANKIRIMEKNDLSKFHAEEFNTEWETFFYQFPKELFMGAIELYVSFDHKQALEMANFGVEWAKTLVNKSRQDEEALLKLSQILLKNFPDQALEVANMMVEPKLKCEALLSIVSQGSDYT